MEYYEKKISFLGENIQIIRKHRGMKQQELANKIGINMQSLSWCPLSTANFDFIGKFLLFHSPVFSYDLYVFS